MKRTTYFFQDCYALLDGELLIIGNEKIERSWRMTQEAPVLLSLKNKKTGKEWTDSRMRKDWLWGQEKKYAFAHADFISGAPIGIDMECGEDDDCGIGRRHLKVSVLLDYGTYRICWTHRVYPGTGLLRSEIQVRNVQNGSAGEEASNGKVISNGKGFSMREVLTQGEQFFSGELRTDYQDAFPLAPVHCKWKSVSFVDRTDDYDNLAHTDHGIISRRESRYVKGNLLFVEDTLDQEGLILVKEGPTPLAYQGTMKSDFYMKGNNIFTTGWGFGAEEMGETDVLTAYGSSVILWEGGEEEAGQALHEYHEAVHVFQPQKDAFIMSNTWGDQSCDGRIGEQFLMEELKAASRLGVTLYQIDDGWQKGTTSNSVNPGGVWGSGYYDADPDFWTVNPVRLPNGLEPIAELAHSLGVRLGLWFSPDSTDNFKNWQRDVETLVELHQKYGIAAFKMDGVKFTSKIGEEHLTCLLREVLQKTKGQVFFNMDVTAETRSGYFGRIHYGTLFVENRFTGVFGAWPNYYPYRTLRNLWMLAAYFPSRRLQMEFLNVAHNRELYEDDILAPACGGLEYSFAVTLCANPLAWMELTGLSEEGKEILAGLLKKYRTFQEDLLRCRIVPIGEEPDGVAWSGFQAMGPDGTGYLQIIRELNEKESHRFRLHGIAGCRLKLEGLMGCTEQMQVEVDEEGRAVFSLKAPVSYAVYRYHMEK